MRTKSNTKLGWILAVGLAGLATVEAADFTSWAKKMPIQFTGYDRAETLTNFSALVTFTNGMVSGFSYADFLSTNADLRFTDATQTNELNYEIEKWDTNGSSVVWVQVPLLANNTTIYAFWGMSGMTAPAYTTNGGTWTNGYAAVWHLAETNLTPGATGGVNRDSTANGNHGTQYYSGSTMSGKIAGAQVFDGAGDYINCGSGASLDVGAVRTISAWVNPTTLKPYASVVGKNSGRVSPHSYLMCCHNDGILRAYDGATWRDSAAAGVAAGNWYHVAYVTKGDGNIYFYVNGQSAGSATWSHTDDPADNVYIGSWRSDVTSYDFAGVIDEVSIASVARSSNWVYACYLNQASNSVFATNFPVQLVAPGIQNGAASNVTAGSTTLNGYLTSTGQAPITAVSVYWGTNDGGTVAANWGNTNNFSPPPQAAGPLATNITGLAENTFYYYRFYASNSLSAAWADSSVSFITGDLTVLATTLNASESGPVNGVFTLTRPDWSTNETLTVTYALAGSAINGTDYASLTSQAIFPVGETHTTVTVIPIADGIAEGSETVDLTLTGGGALGTPSNATVNIADSTWYVATNGFDTNLGTSWGQAFKTISNGIARATAGDLVLVSNGVYNITTQLNINASITLRSLSGAGNTILDAGYVLGRRVVSILSTATNAVLDGFTIQRGYANAPGFGACGAGVQMAAGLVRNCIITSNTVYNQTYGGGVAMTGGTVSNCLITGNNATFGGESGAGVYMNGSGCLLTDSTISSNRLTGGWANYGGAGIFAEGGATIDRCVIKYNYSLIAAFNGGGASLRSSAIMRNSLIVGNQAAQHGGGVYMDNANCRLFNCTVAANYAANTGGGVYQNNNLGTVINAVVCQNNAPTTPNLSGAAPGFSMTSGDPAFVNAGSGYGTNHVWGDYHLQYGSLAIDAGTNLSAQGIVNDLDRVTRPLNGRGAYGLGTAVYDMGCYETAAYDTGALRCGLVGTPLTGVGSVDVTFTAYAAGAPAVTNITYYGWDFGNGMAAGADKRVVTNTFGPGQYTVTLTVSNDLSQAATQTRTNYVQVSGLTTYVATNGTAQYPYDNWDKAATDIQTAINVAEAAFDSGATAANVLVSNGTYNLPGSLLISKGITVEGFGGASNTIIDAGYVLGRRVVSILSTATNAVLDGFTIQRGYAQIPQFAACGGGVQMAAGLVRNCIIKSNTVYNQTYGGGVAMTGGTVSNCLITGNNATFGGESGAGVYMNGSGCLLTDSTISSNRLTGAWADYGGAGIFAAGGATIDRCVIKYNLIAAFNGGGASLRSSAIMRNSLIVGNQAALNGGGVWTDNANCRLFNCTVAGNYAAGTGGGVYQNANLGTVTNAIVCLNNAATTPDFSGTSYGSSLVGAAPGFVNAGSGYGTNHVWGDYHLQLGSLALDTGTNLASQGVVDDLDRVTRPQDGDGAGGTVYDMGCYERVYVAMLGCSISATPVSGLAPLQVVLTANISGGPGDTNIVWYGWNLGNGSLSGAGLGTITNTYDYGQYTVSLTVSNSLNASASSTYASPILAVGPTAYVATNGANIYPYQAWSNAATSLPNAIAVAETAFAAGVGNAAVLVSNGTYNLAGALLISKGIMIQGVGGASNTIVDAGNVLHRRVVDIASTATNAVLDGLTLQRGNLAWKGEDGYGAGVRMAAGRLQNCVIRQNTMATENKGSGIYMTGGSVSNCSVVGNTIVSQGLTYGAGIYLGAGSVVDSLIASNNAPDNGAGIYATTGLIDRCIIRHNYNNVGANNSHGAGVYLGGAVILRNSLVAGNQCDGNSQGGGVYVNHASAQVQNCTIVQNRAGSAGGAGGGVSLASGRILNTILYFNAAASDTNYFGSAAAVSNSCSTPLLTGNNNVTGDPLFKLNGSGTGTNAALGNYELEFGSPCLDTGLDDTNWMATARDLIGSPRILGRHVNMGAYEFSQPVGSSFIFR